MRGKRSLADQGACVSLVVNAIGPVWTEDWVKAVVRTQGFGGDSATGGRR